MSDSRHLVLAAILALAQIGLASCGVQSFANRVDDRTFSIQGPAIPGGAEAPNRRMADRLCPKGYRVLDQRSFKPEQNESNIETDWLIRCL
jgi:hypothetical protein